LCHSWNGICQGSCRQGHFYGWRQDRWRRNPCAFLWKSWSWPDQAVFKTDFI